jgi:dopamine beta-monooxygenase
MEIRFEDYNVPAKETSYICINFEFPRDRDYNIVKMEALVDDPALVHHISVYAVDGPMPHTPYFPCFQWNVIEKDYYAYYIWFWGIGMAPFYYPEDIGFHVGKNGVKHALLQIHYHNPEKVTRTHDSSGVKITLDRRMRKHSASTMRVGAPLTWINIPPGQPNYMVEGNCSDWRTKQIFEHNITVFAFSFHMHTIGMYGYTQHYRNGKLLGDAGREDFYQFDAQRYRDIERFTVMPGDNLITRCFYDSSHQKEITPGGFSAYEEMCWNTYMYYPPLKTKVREGQGHCLH